MKRAFGDELDAAVVQQLAERHFEHLCLTFVEIFRLSVWSKSRLLAATRVVGQEHVEAARAQGRGVIIVTGHLGNWELAAAAMAARDYPVALVAKAQRSRFLEERLAASRVAHGVRVIPMDNPRACFEWMKQGGGVSLAVDQRIREGGAEVPFFGRMARVHTGPATLALRTGAPVLFVSPRRIRPGLHELKFEPLSIIRTGDRRLDISENTAMLQKALESAIRCCPEQWIWEYRIWRRGLRHAMRRDGEVSGASAAPGCREELTDSAAAA